jgi:hypothetical protein
MPRFVSEVFDRNGELVSSVAEPWTKPDLIGAIAYHRWMREEMGITVGDQPVSTQRHEMPVWIGMLLDIMFNPGQRVDFEYKPHEGVSTMLSIPQVLRCYQCFAWYVAECFKTERTLSGMISAGELSDLDTIADLAFDPSFWPQREFPWVP